MLNHTLNVLLSGCLNRLNACSKMKDTPPDKDGRIELELELVCPSRARLGCIVQWLAVFARP